MSTLQQTAAQDPAAGAVFRQLQKAAREAGEVEGRKIPTEEYLVRHALESFLARLNQTPHGQDFVLKGGILLAAYGIRRPTKDVDAEAVAADLTTENLTRIVKDVAAVQAADGVVFDTDTISVEEIREDSDWVCPISSGGPAGRVPHAYPRSSSRPGTAEGLRANTLPPTRNNR